MLSWAGTITLRSIFSSQLVSRGQFCEPKAQEIFANNDHGFTSIPPEASVEGLLRLNRWSSGDFEHLVTGKVIWVWVKTSMASMGITNGLNNRNNYERFWTILAGVSYFLVNCNLCGIDFCPIPIWVWKKVMWNPKLLQSFYSEWKWAICEADRSELNLHLSSTQSLVKFSKFKPTRRDMMKPGIWQIIK